MGFGLEDAVPVAGLVDFDCEITRLLEDGPVTAGAEAGHGVCVACAADRDAPVDVVGAVVDDHCLPGGGRGG